MNNPIFIKIEKVFAYFLCAVILLFIVLSVNDVIRFINYRPDDYPINMDWKIRQVIQGSLIVLAGFFILGITLEIDC